MKKCYLCGGKKFQVKNDKTRDRNNLRVLQCENCSLTLLGSFGHLNDFSYVNSENNYEKEIKTKNDYNKLLAGLKVDDERRFVQWKKLIKNKSVLDFGCGAGGFLKLAKTTAKQVKGVELDNITRFYSKEIEVKKNINNFKEKFDVITLFHVLEHLPDPIKFLKEIKAHLKPHGMIIIEVPNDDDALILYYQCQAFKDFTYWSLHLYSYNKKTLSTICRRAGYKRMKVSFFQRYQLSNHIGWLKDGKPGGHKIYAQLNDFDLNNVYNEVLKKMNYSDTLIMILKN